MKITFEIIEYNEESEKLLIKLNCDEFNKPNESYPIFEIKLADLLVEQDLATAIYDACYSIAKNIINLERREASMEKLKHNLEEMKGIEYKTTFRSMSDSERRFNEASDLSKKINTVKTATKEYIS